MGLKRTGNYRAAAVLGVVTIAMLAMEVVIAIHIITQAGAKALIGPWVLAILPFGIFYLSITLALEVVLGIAAFVFVMREGGMRAAAEHDSRGAPLATYQPEAALALKGGETLTLTRTRRASGVRQFIRTLLVSLVLALIGDAMVVLVLPAFSPLRLLDVFLPFATQAPAPAPSPLDWVSLAYPAALGLGLFLAAAPATVRDRRQRIVADDQGITVAMSGHRQRFMHWNDILVFARPADNTSASPVGDYLLWGREHGLALQIGTRKMPSEDVKTRERLKDVFEYEGGYEAYEANARRLLATITARSSVPLRTFARATAILSWLKRRFPAQAVELEDVLAAPEADAMLQPRAETLAAMAALDAAVTLRARIAVLPALLGTAAVSVLLAAVIVGVFALVSASSPSMIELWQELQAVPGVWIAVTACVIAIILIGPAAAFAFERRRDRIPAVSADAAGLRIRMRTGGRGGRMTTLPWGSIRGWAVLPPEPGSGWPATYIAFTEDQKLIWREPENARLAGRGVRGDRREAYRERAETLHALIAARTLLPLKTLAKVEAVAVSKPG